MTYLINGLVHILPLVTSRLGRRCSGWNFRLRLRLGLRRLPLLASGPTTLRWLGSRICYNYACDWVWESRWLVTLKLSRTKEWNNERAMPLSHSSCSEQPISCFLPVNKNMFPPEIWHLLSYETNNTIFQQDLTWQGIYRKHSYRLNRNLPFCFLCKDNAKSNPN